MNLTSHASSLTYIPAVNRHKDIDGTLQAQKCHTQHHQTLQQHTAPGPHVWHQQTHFPPEVLPCRPGDHLDVCFMVLLSFINNKTTKKCKYSSDKDVSSWNWTYIVFNNVYAHLYSQHKWCSFTFSSRCVLFRAFVVVLACHCLVRCELSSSRKYCVKTLYHRVLGGVEFAWILLV